MISRKKNFENKILIIALIVSLLNFFFFTNKMVSLIYIFVQCVILLYLLFKNELVDYFCLYVVFIGLSFEYSVTSDIEFYSFKNTEIGGLNIGIIFLFILALKLLIKSKLKISISVKNNKVNKFNKRFIFIIIGSSLCSVLTILLNDNNILEFYNPLSVFFQCAYLDVIVPLTVIFCMSIFVTTNEEICEKLKKSILAVVIGSSVILILSFTLGKTGTYGGMDTLISNGASIYIPLFLSYPLFRKISLIKYLFIICGFVLLLAFNSSGNVIVLSLVSLNVISMKMLTNKKNWIKMISVLLVPLILLIIFIGINFLSQSNNLFNYKLLQVRALFNVFNPNWFDYLPYSPRIRVIEFGNIILEYVQKPLYIMFGKGYAGTITDNLGLFTINNSAFDEVQFASGVFYNLHTSINEFLLKNGIAGLALYIFVLKEVISNWKKSVYLLLGGYWFLIVYGYSFNLTLLGVVSLYIGFIDIDKTQEGGRCFI